jgi:maltose O-acetyltransferase
MPEPESEPETSSADAPAPPSFGATLERVVREELSFFHPRLRWMYLRERFLRRGGSGSRRAALMRGAGFALGEGALVQAVPRITGSAVRTHADGRRTLFENLVIGRDATIEQGVVLDLEDRITIGDRAVIGPQVMILTSSHELGPREHRAGPLIRQPVTISDGAWVGARSVLLPGVVIGEGAVVAAGSVVNKDVPPHTHAGGSPARKIAALTPPE